MNNLKRYAGIIWMLLGPLVLFALIYSALQNIGVPGKGDTGKPLPWIIIITVFAPVAIGMCVFGWYAWKGEYEEKETDR